MTMELDTIICNYKTDDGIVYDLEKCLEQCLDFDRYGRYNFIHCEFCGGPELGHRYDKCRNTERYNPILVKMFEDKIRSMKGVRNVVDKYTKGKENEEKEKRTDEIKTTVEAAVKGVIEIYERKGAGNAVKQTTQLVKPRFPPI